MIVDDDDDDHHRNHLNPDNNDCDIYDGIWMHQHIINHLCIVKMRRSSYVTLRSANWSQDLRHWEHLTV